MTYYGDKFAGASFFIPFNTISTSGAPTAMAGSPAVRVYRDDGTTEDDSGITLTEGFDSRTGLNLVKIDTSADATFYANGYDFFVVITSGTVGGTSVVGTVVGCFSIGNRPVNTTKVNGAAATMTAGAIDANVTQINGTTVGGDGSAGDPWGPA